MHEKTRLGLDALALQAAGIGLQLYRPHAPGWFKWEAFAAGMTLLLAGSGLYFYGLWDMERRGSGDAEPSRAGAS